MSTNCDMKVFKLISFLFLSYHMDTTETKFSVESADSHNLFDIGTIGVSQAVSNVNPSFAHFLKDIFSRYSKSWTYPVVANLEDFMIQISGHMTCFVVVDNFQGINVFPVGIPVVLRTPTPILEEHIFTHRLRSSRTQTIHKIILGIYMSHLRNLSLPKDLASFRCPLSKFLVGYIKSRNVCLLIKSAEFFRNARPTNCQIHLGIYPSEFTIRDPAIYPSMLQGRHGKFPRHLSTPSAIPLIKVIIFNKTEDKPCEKVFQEVWVRGKSDISNYAYEHNVFIVGNIGKVQIPQLPGLESHGLLRRLEVLVICPGCPYNGISKVNIRYANGAIVKVTMKTFKQSAIFSGTFPSTDELLIWAHFTASDANLFTKTIRHIKSRCVWSNKNFMLQLLAARAVLEKAAIGHSDVWNSVMRNYTFQDEPTNSKCTSMDKGAFAISLLQKEYLKPFFIFPHFPQDSLNQLRLVGCGRQGMSDIAVMELFNVFDEIIWTCIPITILLVSIFIKLLINHSHLHCLLFSSLKVLLEQGDPFPSIIANSEGQRIPLGIFLLLSIVISNSYKNSNVYNMIVPRSPILYKHLRELVRDNFKIYTRSVNSFQVFDGKVRFTGKLPLADSLGHGTCFEFANCTVTCESEMRQHAKIQKAYVDTLRVPQHTNVSNAEAELTKLAQFLPNLGSLFKEYLHDNFGEFPFKRISRAGLRYWIHAMFPRLQNVERIALLQSLEECQKSAVVVPDHISKEYYNTLVNQKGIQDIFVAEESFASMERMFFLEGCFVPPRLVKRIHTISESGVWEWWVQLFREKRLQTKIANKIESATISGNIVIIFAVWGSGVVLSGLIFSLECGRLAKLCRFLNLGRMLGCAGKSPCH